MKKDRVLGIAAVFLATMFWSFGGVFGRKSGAPGVVLTFWRLGIGTGLFGVILLVTRTGVRWSQMRRCWLAGVCFGLNIAAFFTALEYMSVATALIIAALGPVVALPVAAVVYHEPITAPKVACGVVAIAGVILAVVAAPAPESARRDGWLGYAWAIASLLLWIGYLLLSKRLREDLKTVPFLFSCGLFAIVTVGVLVVLLGEDFDTVPSSGWVWVALLAIVPGILGHGLAAWSQPRVEASVLSLLIQSEPVFAAVTAWIFLGETVSGGQAAAMASVIAALCVLAWYEAG